MAQDYTVRTITDRGKQDAHGNGTFNVTFEEDTRTVYAAFKNPPQVGQRRFGSILQSEYGFRWKGEQKPDDYQAPQTQTGDVPIRSGGGSMTWSNKPKTVDEQKRSDDIRWGLCIKEANAYIIQNRPDLSSEDWAKEVNEYANALYAVSGGPSEVNKMLDDADDQPLDLAKIPF